MKTSVKRRAKNCIRGAVLLTCFIAVWYVASCFTQPLFIPAPATVWEAIVGLAETGQLQKGLAYSFLRITGASALSMLVAIPLSLLIYGVKPIKVQSLATKYNGKPAIQAPRSGVTFDAPKSKVKEERK